MRSARLPGWIVAAEYSAAFAALAAALGVNLAAGRLADVLGESAPVSPDLLLSVLPRLDTDVVYIYGYGLFLVWLAIVVGLWERRRAPYIAWAFALLIVLRSFFIILTPLHLPMQELSVADDPLYRSVGRFLTFKHDLFFSSHTATPFMAFLVVRGRWVRLSFLLFSIVLAGTVLLGRHHYSIDVFAAYFITYAVHKGEIRWFQPFYHRLRARLAAL